MHNRDKPWITGKCKKLIEESKKLSIKETIPCINSYIMRRTGKRLNLDLSTFERKLNHLESNLNPKKWWDSVKELAGYRKKSQIPINFFDADNQTLTGVTLANKINEEFSAVSQEYTPLRPLVRTNEHLDSPVEYIISLA